MTTPSGGMRPAAYWNIEITGGWMYLLPPLAERRVLCISSMRPSQSASQSPLYGELTLLYDSQLDGIPSEQDLANSGATGLRWRSIDSLFGGAVSEQQRFDGLVIHDPEGAIVHGGNLPRILQVLRHIPSLLGPGAFVYVGVPNPRSLPSVIASVTRRGKTPGRRQVPIPALVQALGSAGFADIRIHPYLTWGSKLAEVIPPRGYLASKNCERPAERVKELVYGRIGSRRLAPAYGILAYAEHAARSTLDVLFEHIAGASYYQGSATPVLKNYLLFPGSKAIVTCGPEGQDDCDLVAVLTADALAIERRNIEVAVLSELANLPKRLAHAIPRPLAQIAIGKTRCYLLNRLPGVTLDIESAALDQVTDQALEFVIDLHRASTQQVATDESNYRKLFWSLVEAAQSRIPAMAAGLQSWDVPLRACVMGTLLPSVWMHGDYKVENVMYDRVPRKLTGVIDWELARGPGLPLLDPLYLLIYNRQIRGEEHFQSIESILWPGRRNDLELAQLRRYVEGVRVPEKLVPALCAMFFAHHIGCRLHIRADSTALEQLRIFIPRIRQMLEQSAAQSHSIASESRPT